jgi:hypothetical protein
MLAMQGCGASTPAAQAAPRSAHSLSFGQAETIYQAYQRTTDAAATSGDATTGESVVGDAGWEAVHAEYTALASERTPVPRYQYGTPVFYVPARSNWFLVVVRRRQLGTGQPSTGQPSTGKQGSVTTLMVFAQDRPTANWTLDGTAALGPGQSLPAIARQGDGYAVPLVSNDRSLLLPPDVVGPTQAAVVDDGPASAAAAVVADGPQTTGLYAQQADEGRAATATGLDYTWLMESTSFPVFALQTADGGALVLYGVYMNTTNEHPDAVKGTPIPIPTSFVPLLAAPTEIGYHAVYGNWTYEFAATDPPATDQNGKLNVIGATGELSYTHAY